MQGGTYDGSFNSNELDIMKQFARDLRATNIEDGERYGNIGGGAVNQRTQFFNQKVEQNSTVKGSGPSKTTSIGPQSNYKSSQSNVKTGTIGPQSNYVGSGGSSGTSTTYGKNAEVTTTYTLGPPSGYKSSTSSVPQKKVQTTTTTTSYKPAVNSSSKPATIGPQSGTIGSSSSTYKSSSIGPQSNTTGSTTYVKNTYSNPPPKTVEKTVIKNTYTNPPPKTVERTVYKTTNVAPQTTYIQPSSKNIETTTVYTTSSGNKTVTYNPSTKKEIVIEREIQEPTYISSGPRQERTVYIGSNQPGNDIIITKTVNQPTYNPTVRRDVVYTTTTTTQPTGSHIVTNISGGGVENRAAFFNRKVEQNSNIKYK
ncbi:MAG: hypothetical protein MJ252_26270 [archaeon]|nr:hypothetical protein [archaeon]